MWHSRGSAVSNFSLGRLFSARSRQKARSSNTLTTPNPGTKGGNKLRHRSRLGPCPVLFRLTQSIHQRANDPSATTTTTTTTTPQRQPSSVILYHHHLILAHTSAEFDTEIDIETLGGTHDTCTTPALHYTTRRGDATKVLHDQALLLRSSSEY